MDKGLLTKVGVCLIVIAAIIISIAFIATPDGKKIQNEYEQVMVQADLESDYKTSLDTEKTLRSYKASYEADKITYISNKDAETKETQELARAAKTRANRTAANYNELLKSSILDHIKFPEDLETELEYIE